MQIVFLWYSCSANSILVPLIVISLLQIVMAFSANSDVSSANSNVSLLQIVMSCGNKSCK